MEKRKGMSMDKLYAAMTEEEKQAIDLCTDYGDIQAAESLLRQKERELKQEIPLMRRGKAR